ncbi:hypothetical protein [Pseudoalteromonas sp.]|uniref:hypothetical protein n=1 Tax=Pseudoalteromonas sp. TaxID=53249 RepID=UPI0035647E45
MKKLTTASLLALGLIANTSFSAVANETTDVTTQIQQAAAAGDASALEALVAQLIAANSNNPDLNETEKENVLQQIADAANAAGITSDTFTAIAVANGADAGAVSTVTNSFTAAGPGQGANQGNAGNNNNNGVGQGQGNGRTGNRGNNGGKGGGGGGGGISENNGN